MSGATWTVDTTGVLDKYLLFVCLFACLRFFDMNLCMFFFCTHSLKKSGQWSENKILHLLVLVSNICTNETSHIMAMSLGGHSNCSIL